MVSSAVANSTNVAPELAKYRRVWSMFERQQSLLLQNQKLQLAPQMKMDQADNIHCKVNGFLTFSD